MLQILLYVLFGAAGFNNNFRDAVDLYDRGLYVSAREEFSRMADDALTDGYEILCALQMKSEGTDGMVESYTRRYGITALSPEIFFLNGRILFDEGRYEESLSFLQKIDEKDIPEKFWPEITFRKGYCQFVAGRYPEAKKTLLRIEDLPVSIHTAPSRYLQGFMNYTEKRFDEAEPWFNLAGKDPRFTSVCAFYATECRFMGKDYEYVTQNAGKLMDDVPQTRKAHLARILSESYLVLDDKQKAREYYDMSYQSNLTRSDYFYAGSVLYAVDDYAGAIENYEKMEDRSDSLGQIANYNLANAYLRTRNKVAALDAFRAASEVPFDAEIQEDAFMNYAKLAFDLNQDNSGFESYIRKYSTSRRGEQIYGYMALTALNRRDYAAAVEAYDNIDELDAGMKGNYVRANFLRGLQLYQSGAFRDAIECLRAAAFYLPRQNRLNQLIRYWLAETYYKAGNYSEAEKIYSDLYNISALQGTAEGDALPYNLAYSQFNQGEYETAARWFDNYVSSGISFGKEDALLRRADCDFENKDYKAAISSYGKAIELLPDNLYPYYRQAMSYGLSGDRKSKISILSKAVLKDPSAPMFDESLYELGRTYMDSKNSKEAMNSFKRLRETTRDSIYVAKALLGLGMIDRNQNRLDDALVNYKQVVSIMAGSEYAQEALQAIESIYQAKRQPEKYLEYIESNSLLSAEGNEKEALYFNTAEQLFLAGNYQQAIGALTKFLEDYPSSTKAGESCFYIAESYKALGAKEKACDYYEKVWTLYPDNSFVEQSLISYSGISFELEHFQDAYKGYSALLLAAKIESNKIVARTGMMRSSYRAKDYSLAISASEQIASMKTSDEALLREADYINAKSKLASSNREGAMDLFRKLAGHPDTPEGAEASYLIAQDYYDRGDFDKIESAVYDFSMNYGDQAYWLARAFIVLGDCFVEKGKNEQAKVTYESIRDGYESPDGNDDIADMIQGRLDRLEKLMNE